MPRTVVIGMDNSEISEFAFDFYVEQAMIKDDKIILVHVSEYTSLVQAPTLLTDPVVVSDLIKEEEVKVKQLIDKYSEKMIKLRLGGRVKQMAGNTGEALVAVAKDEDAGLIVLGTRGMGKVKRTFIGSLYSFSQHLSLSQVEEICFLAAVICCPRSGTVGYEKKYGKHY